jgi:hypothetical protein
LTDSDLGEIEMPKKKYNVNLTLRGNASLFRAIYLLEAKHEFPAPIRVDVFLEPNETCYFEVATTWYQSHVQSYGYAGGSISLPMGIRGVRFRFGRYTPVRAEQITPLASGTLFVTSKRLLFAGGARSTSIALKKIVDGHVYFRLRQNRKKLRQAGLFFHECSASAFHPLPC